MWAQFPIILREYFPAIKKITLDFHGTKQRRLDMVASRISDSRWAGLIMAFQASLESVKICGMMEDMPELMTRVAGIANLTGLEICHCRLAFNDSLIQYLPSELSPPVTGDLSLIHI